MGKGTFSFNNNQRKLILGMNVPDMIELFSLTNENVGDFLYALHIQPKELALQAGAFQFSSFEGNRTVGVARGGLSFKDGRNWIPVSENYRILGVYISEHVHKDPFLFLQKPEIRKPKITIIDMFFEMSLSELGATAVDDLLRAEVIPAQKERALRRAVERLKKKKKYTVGEIFTKMPLSRVGNLSLSEFFGAEVFGVEQKKSKV